VSTEKPDGVSPANTSEPAQVEAPQPFRGRPPFAGDTRLFIALRGTGGKNGVHTLADIHANYVVEFISHPGFGLGRWIAWNPGEWVELLADGSSGETAVDQVLPERAAIPAGAEERATGLHYDERHQRLRRGDGEPVEVREHVWVVRDMQLVSLLKPNSPAVYLPASVGAHLPKEVRITQGPDGKEVSREVWQPVQAAPAVPTRALDRFEVEGLVQLRRGAGLVVRTTPEEMRLLGAVRARKQCLACYGCKEGDLLGAFTYTLTPKNEGTPVPARLADTDGLRPDEIAAVRAVEDLGGTVRRDDTQPGRPITEVRLQERKVKNADLQGIRAFKQLRILDVSYTKITDTGLKELQELKGLRTLNIAGNDITDAGLRDVQGFTELEELNLWSTKVTDAGMKELRGLKRLRALYLAFTPVTDAGMKDLTALTDLRKLELMGVHITDVGLKDIKELKQLEELGLDRTRITSAGLKELRELRHLRTLELGLTEIRDAGLKEVKELKNLQVLRIADTKVTDEGLKELQELTQLESLDVTLNRITDEGLKHLKGLKKLRRLHLANAEVTDAGLKELRAFEQLQELSLWSTPVTDAGLAELKDFRQLRTLNLHAAKVTAAGVADLRKALPECRIEYE
jgi:hypothetical protein